MTSSRAWMEPTILPDKRADSALIEPWTSLDSPCTREAQEMSPSILPSICRSTVALTSPLMVTSDPITEKVELFTGIGVILPCCLSAVGRGSSAGFFENMWGCLQKGARIYRAVIDTHLEMKMRPSRAAGGADRADDIAGFDFLPRLGAES